MSIIHDICHQHITWRLLYHTWHRRPVAFRHQVCRGKNSFLVMNLNFWLGRGSMRNDALAFGWFVLIALALLVMLLPGTCDRFNTAPVDHQTSQERYSWWFSSYFLSGFRTSVSPFFCVIGECLVLISLIGAASFSLLLLPSVQPTASQDQSIMIS